MAYTKIEMISRNVLFVPLESLDPHPNTNTDFFANKSL